MTILITGATGAIGMPLCKHLLKNHRVTVLVRNSRAKPAKHLKRLGAKLLKGSFPNNLPSAKRLEKFDVVIHLAALIGFSFRGNQHQRINVEGTRKLLSRLNPKTHLLFTSTTLIHGPADKPLPESSPINPLDPYTSSKAKAETTIRAYHQKRGQQFTILRPAFVVTLKPSGLRKKFLKLARLPILPLPGGGNNLLPFISYKDLIRAIELLLIHGPLNEAILIAHQRPLPLKSMLARSDDSLPRILPLPSFLAALLPPYLRALLTENWNFDIGKAEKHLSWTPQFDPFTHKPTRPHPDK